MAAYAEARGWDLHPETYSDEGVSGFSGANLDGDLGRFLADLKRGHFGTQPVALGVEDIDRLSRQFTLAFLPVLIDQLINAGVTISVVSKGRDFSRESIKANGFELQELLLYLQQAHEFSEKLSSRITDHRGRIRASIRDGKPANPGTAPSWISLVNGQWALNGYAGVIREVIAMSQAGDGAPIIAKTMNARGVINPGTAKKRRTNPDAEPQPWAANHVLQVLKQPAIHGARLVAKPGHNSRLRNWKEECARLKRQGKAESELPPRPQREFESEQPNYYPALLSEPEHRLLLQQISDRANPGHSRGGACRWIGQELTTCSECGSALKHFHSRGRKGEIYNYLRCAGKERGICSAPLQRFDPLQAHVLTRLSVGVLQELLGLDATGAQQRELAAAIDAMESRRGDLDRVSLRHAAGERALEEADDPSELKVLVKRQSALEMQLEAAKQQLADAEIQVELLSRRPPAAEAAAEIQEHVSKLFKTFDKGEDTFEQRKSINQQFKRIGLKIQVDTAGGRVGMAIGDGELDWQPLAPAARRYALNSGMVDPIAAKDTATGLQVAVAGGLESGAPGPAADGSKPGVVTVITSEDATEEAEVLELLREQGLEPVEQGS